LRIESLSLPALLDSITSPHSPYEFNKLIISSEENKIKENDTINHLDRKFKGKKLCDI